MEKHRALKESTAINQGQQQHQAALALKWPREHSSGAGGHQPPQMTAVGLWGGLRAQAFQGSPTQQRVSGHTAQPAVSPALGDSPGCVPARGWGCWGWGALPEEVGLSPLPAEGQAAPADSEEVKSF